MKLKYLLLIFAVILLGTMFYFLPKIQKQLKKQEAQQEIEPLSIKPVPQAIPVSIPILMYHHIKDEVDPQDPYDADLSVSIANFKTQMGFLNDEKYHSVHLEDLIGFWYEGKALPENPIILTFDDGYFDFLENARPILKENGLTATVAPIVKFVGEEKYLEASEIKYLSDQGIEIASHTKSHQELDKLDEATQKEELTDSKKFFEDLILKPVNVIVYPIGKYNITTIKLSNDAGYRLGVTTKAGQIQDPEKPFEIKRLRIHGSTTLEQFGALLNTTK